MTDEREAESGQVMSSKGWMKPSEVAAPQWEKAGRVHDWRNHVGEHTKKIWSTFTPEQKMAIALDADDLASAEYWD